MRRRIVLAVALTVVASLALSARSFGAVTIGVSLDQPSSGIVGAGGGATFVQTALPGGVNQSPITGVAVRYRVQSNVWGDIRLRILRPVAGTSTFDAVGTSATSSLTGAFDDLVHEFPARLPISAGDHIGIDATNSARIRNTLPAGSTYGYWFPILADPDPPSAPTPGGGMTHAILLNADVELDADRDGFGDETQDACPTDASTQAACPVAPVAAAPQAKTKKRCKKKRKKTGAKGASAAKKKKCKRKKRRK
jgi:hypothetical protein